jgi:hypothetical protein
MNDGEKRDDKGVGSYKVDRSFVRLGSPHQKPAGLTRANDSLK